ncbi:MobA/MobL family protein, partial [Acetobacter sicerae]
MDTTAHFHFGLNNFGPSALRDRVDYITRTGAYQDRDDLVAVESGNLPAWALSAKMFWDAVEQRETGNAADSFILAVPRNLSPEAVTRLRERFGQTLAQGRPYTLAEHCDVARDYEESRHFHALVSPRTLDSVNRSEALFFARYRPKHPRAGGGEHART